MFRERALIRTSPSAAPSPRTPCTAPDDPSDGTLPDLDIAMSQSASPSRPRAESASVHPSVCRKTKSRKTTSRKSPSELVQRCFGLQSMPNSSATLL
jgi:hypothetical protein